MATKAEIDEVKEFLASHNGWSDIDADDFPELKKRLDDDSEPIAYSINSVIEEAGLLGSVEEYGNDSWFVNGTNDDGTALQDEEDEEDEEE